MIEVTVKLNPFGQAKSEEEKKVLGRIHIVNDGTGNVTKGNYIVRLLSRGKGEPLMKEGHVEAHLRRDVSVWKLVARALASVGHAC